MKIHLMRSFAVAAGISLWTAGVSNVTAADQRYDQRYAAQPSYQAPAKWNNFGRPSAPLPPSERSAQMPFGATFQAVAAHQQVEDLPMPTGEQQLPPDTVQQGQTEIPPHSHAQDPAVPLESSVHPYPFSESGCQTCSDGTASPYASAASAPCEDSQCETCAPSARSGPYPIAPWFGGANLLFWDVAGGNESALINYDNGVTVSRYSDLDPANSVGFDVHFGRYLACGQYGLDFGFLSWDPDAYSRIFTDGGAGLVFINPALNTVSINRGGGATTVYDEYNTNASAIRVTRDLRVQGFEANLNCFGLMGARRLGSCSPAPICGGAVSNLAHCGSGYYGGATGPLARAACGRVRVQTLHGFRWFQLEDELEVAGNVDGTAGYQPTDLYYLSETENNLFGYQFGSRLAYCLGCRALINVGGKVGIYANDARFSHRITTDTAMAYTNSQGAGAGDICTDYSDVSLAGLGEFDLGLGYRLSNRWTVNTGYRALAVCGVATAIGQMPTEYTTAASAGAVRADDSLILHGVYVGFDYNW